MLFHLYGVLGFWGDFIIVIFWRGRKGGGREV